VISTPLQVEALIVTPLPRPAVHVLLFVVKQGLSKMSPNAPYEIVPVRLRGSWQDQFSQYFPKRILNWENLRTSANSCSMGRARMNTVGLSTIGFSASPKQHYLFQTYAQKLPIRLK
jgi:hypothetical protein